MRYLFVLLVLSMFVFSQTPLYLCPSAIIVGPSNASLIATYISKAHKAVYIEVYALTWKELADTLAALANRGVQVYLVLSANVYGGIPTTEKKLVQYLQSAGVHIVFNNDFKFVHTKAFVIDNETVILGSINPTYSGVTNDKGLDVVVNDPSVAKEIATIILNDFNGVYPQYDFSGVVISPINSYGYLKWLLSQPGRVYAAVEEIYSSSGLADLLASKAALAIARVTDVEGVQRVPDLTAKVIVVGDLVYVGSVNLSGSSIRDNRELGFIFYCPSLARSAVSLIKEWAGSESNNIAYQTTSSGVGHSLAEDALIVLAVAAIFALALLRRKRV